MDVNHSSIRDNRWAGIAWLQTGFGEKWSCPETRRCSCADPPSHRRSRLDIAAQGINLLIKPAIQSSEHKQKNA